MAKGVGLDAGEFEVKVVELDGSYRRPKLTKASVDRVSQLTSSAADPDHALAEATALQHAVKDAHVGKQNVCLGFSSREALFRQLTVPFTGTERIRKVIKFEAEGEIHSQSVDDMVIDFHTIEELEGETRVLVAGVPKNALRTTLAALERVGLEPETVDLDSMAMYRVAKWCGALGELDADEEPDGSPPLGDVEGLEDGEDAWVLVDGESTAGTELRVGLPGSRLILNVGARQVVVLVITDGNLLDMRAIPMGCDSVAEDVAHRTGISLDEARDAVIHALQTGMDYELAAADEDDTGAEPDPDSEALVPLPRRVSSQVVTEARDRFLSRLRREFMRFLVSVKGVGRVEATFTTGAGSLLAGMNEMLADVFGVQSRPLRFMHLLQHNLTEEEAADLEPRIAVAVGLALSHFNGVKGFDFRQEDLVFTRGFDRIKLPLAIACMLALFYLFFYGVGLHRELQAKEKIFGFAVERTATGASTGRRTGEKVTVYNQFTGYLTHLVNEGTWPERSLPHNEYRTLVNQIAEQPTFKRINWYYAKLSSILKARQRAGEYEPTLALDSSVAVLQQFAGVIASVEKQLGRFYIGEVTIKLPTKKAGRMLSFVIFIRGENFRDQNQFLVRALEQQFADKESPFESMKPATQNPVAGEAVGCYYTYNIELREQVPVKAVN